MFLLTLRIEKKKITWGFAYEHDLNRTVKMMLPMVQFKFLRLEDHDDSDLYVGVALTEWNVPNFLTLANYKPVYLLSGEPGQRYDTDEAIQFVNCPFPEEKNPDLIRYCPTLLQWVPSFSIPKLRACSVIDSGRWKWRAAVISRIEATCPGITLDKFGKGYNRPLQGYHVTGKDSQFTNDKYLGLKAHAFNLAIENTSCDDYITEKFYDAILCECVPIYYGCQNLQLWSVPGCYIPVQEASKILHDNWKDEYGIRRNAVLEQKKHIINTWNYLSYFVKLLDDQNELQNKRCFTLETVRKSAPSQRLMLR